MKLESLELYTSEEMHQFITKVTKELNSRCDFTLELVHNAVTGSFLVPYENDLQCITFACDTFKTHLRVFDNMIVECDPSDSLA